MSAADRVHTPNASGPGPEQRATRFEVNVERTHGWIKRLTFPTLDGAREAVFVEAWHEDDPYGLSLEITEAGGVVVLSDGTTIRVAPVG